MYKRSLFLLANALLSGSFADVKAEISNPKLYPAPKLPPSELAFDRDFSPFAGAGILTTYIRALEKLEDSALRGGVYKRGFWPGFLRFLEIGFYGTQTSLATVTQHEVFGHGYRIRDLGKDVAVVNGYKISIEEGLTKYDFKEGSTPSQRLSFHIAGIESEYIFSRELKKQYLQLGSIPGREANLYSRNALGGLGYTLTLGIYDSPGHDIRNYRDLINTTFPGADLGNVALKRKFLLNLVDPMLYYSIWAQWNYILFAKNAPIPMIKIKNVKFLPNLRLELSPFGPETYIENYMLFKDKLHYFYTRFGNCGGNQYYGFGWDSEILKRKNATFGIKVEFWKQPKMALKLGEAMPSDSLIGALLTVSERVKFGGVSWFGEFGGKTEGFVPGQSLKEALIARFGIQINF